MTQPDQTNPIVEQLKAVLRTNSDDALAAFLRGYVLGSAADEFISLMIGPGQRVQFLTAIAQAYPDDWKQAVERLATGV